MKEQKCAYENCEAEATTLAKGRNISYALQPNVHAEIAKYCDKHARIVADEHDPEYIEACPNCGCMFGVN